MKDEEIRPQLLIKKQSKLIEKDAQILLKRKHLFKNIDCPACGLKNKKFFFKKRGFVYNICKNCNTYFISPRPSNELLKNFYQNSKNMKFWAEKIFPKTRKTRIKKIFKPRADFLVKKFKNFFKKKNKFNYLEIGAGDGSFANEIRKKNFFASMSLIEPNKECAKICKRLKFNLTNDIFENSEKKLQKFDCIAFFEVIEHINYPLNFLKKCHLILKKKGMIFLSCPNGEGFDVSLMGKDSNVIDHEHLTYFNINSIKKILRRSGFKIVELSTPGKLDVDIVFNYLKKKKNFTINWISKLDERAKKQLQKTIQENKISSHMLVIAQKI